MRRPTAFTLDEVRYEPEELYPPDEPLPVPAAVRRRPRGHWLALLLSSLGGLVLLAIGLGIDQLVRDLYDRSAGLGWLGLALAVLAAVALIVLAAREITALMRLRLINHVHTRAVTAAAGDDRDAALTVLAEIEQLYKRRPETARGRAALAAHRKEIIDGRDLIALAETELLLPIDAGAHRMVMNAAKRVALVTAISPRALVDLVFVGSQVLRLIRQIATLYGGRPGTIGFLRLARATLTHLAVTGGMAAGDSLVQQVLGTGIAARLSARLGEGAVNGLLTARIGIAAIEVCRPLPFINGSPPRLVDVVAALRPLATEKAV